MGKSILVKEIKKPRDNGETHQAVIKAGNNDFLIIFKVDEKEGSIALSNESKAELVSIGIDPIIVKGAVRQKLHSMIENGEY